MPGVPLHRIVRHCDQILRTRTVHDWEAAWNGLQVEKRGPVTRLAAAVDASGTTIRMAADAGADLLIVHHGLFWNQRHPWTGSNYDLLQQVVEHNIAIYSSHLPLDLHGQLGNNIELCHALGLRRLRPFFFQKGQNLGFQTTTRILRSELVQRLRRATGGTVRLLPGGPALCQRIGVVTGGAGGDLKIAAEAGVDTFITGEGPHWTFSLAEELGINVLYGGHYATETFGVKALTASLAKKFRIPWVFLDHPSGL